MGKVLENISEHLASRINEQNIFFVAVAPIEREGLPASEEGAGPQFS